MFFRNGSAFSGKHANSVPVFDWRQTSLGCLQAEAADSMSFLSQDFPAMFRCADVLRENFFVHAVHTFFVAMAHCAKFSP